MGAKQCELCDRPARIHCESDQASLCWGCDTKVHGANFLVARHSRCLLCRGCQSPTPWRAEGPRLGPTVSVCERCSTTATTEGSGGEGCSVDVEEDEEGEEEGEEEGVGGNGDGEEDEEEDEEDDEEDDEEEDGNDDVGEDDEGENQVVPWSLTPPPEASSSSSEDDKKEEDEAGRVQNGGRFSKRMRKNADLAFSQDDLACFSCPGYLTTAPTPSPALVDDETTSAAAAFRPSNDRNRAALLDHYPVQPAVETAAPSVLDLRVHGSHRRGVGLLSRRMTSSNPERYKNLEG